jgi:antitoxin PrlF
MLAVVTSKGQLTLPKGIREHLGLKAGSRLDFSVNEQGWLLARPVTNTALGLAGLMRRPGQAAVSVEDMAEAVVATAAELNAPASPKKPTSTTSTKKPAAAKRKSPSQA